MILPRVATVAAIIVVAIAGFACGGDDDSSSPTTGPGTPTPTATTPDEPTLEPTGEATDTVTPTDEPSETATGGPSSTATDEPSATPTGEPSGTATEEPSGTPTEEPTEPAVLVTVTPPAAYPTDDFPLMDGALVTAATENSVAGRANYTLLFAISGVDVDSILDFYQKALEDAGWTVDYSGSQGENKGSVVGSKGDSAADGSFILSVERSTQIDPGLDVSIFVTLPE